MFGYRIHGWGEVPVWEEIPDPTPGPGEVAIEVEACGVGLTVLNCINGDLDDGRATLPRVPGHELVGRVTDLGDEVPADLLGRRVVAYFYLFCGECASCTKGREPLCERLQGFVGVHRDGGYAPRVVLPARSALPIPDDLDPVQATVVPDALATPVHVANRAGIDADDRVAVIGAGGGVGAHMIQVAAGRASAVAGLDMGPEKLAAVIGSRYASRAEVVEAARLVASGDIDPVIGTVRGPGDVLEIHEQLGAGSLIGRGALDWREA